MKYCIISPYAQKMRNKQQHPKDYPFWDKIIDYLHSKNIAIKQIGVKDELKINGVGDFPGDDFLLNLKFYELSELVKNSYKWLSIDSFFPHFCHHLDVPGIVIFSQSDPLLFGYKENINLLKDRKYLRPDQFGIWEDAHFNIESFIDPSSVYKYL